MNGRPLSTSVVAALAVALSVVLGTPVAEAAEVGAVTGQVVDQAGNPIPQVCVRPEPGVPNTMLYPTDASGVFRLDDLPAGTYQLEVWHCARQPQYIPQWYGGTTRNTATPVVVRTGETTSLPRIAMELGGSLSGRVVAENGDGLPATCLYLAGDVHGTRPIDGPDANGDFRAAALRPGSEYTVEAQDCTQGRYATTFFGSGGSRRDAERITVVAGADRTGVNIVMPLGATVRGRVVESTGGAIPGACVRLEQQPGDIVAQVSTDDQGNYVVTKVWPGPTMVQFIRCIGTRETQWHPAKPAQADAQPLPLVAGSETPGIDGTLPAAGSITGRVTDALGTPLVACQLDLQTEAGDRSSGVVTQPDGTYQALGLRPALYHVQLLRCPDRPDVQPMYWPLSSGLAGAVRVPVLAGVSTPEINLITRLGSRIAGRITDVDGAGVRTCVSTRALTGDLLGPRTTSATSDLEGYFTIAGLSAGSYTVHAHPCFGHDLASAAWRDPGATGTAAGLIALGVDSLRSGVDITMLPGGHLTGRVLGPDGQGLSGLCVIADSTMFFDLTSTKTAADGSYVLTGLGGDSPYRIRIRDCDRYTYATEYVGGAVHELATPFAVAPRARVVAPDITARLAGSISGVVRDEAGNRFRGACIVVYNSDNRYVTGDFTEAEGTYLVRSLAPGVYRVSFQRCQGGVAPPRWWRDGSSLGTADPVVVRAGENSPGIDMTFRTLDIVPALPGAPGVVAPAVGTSPTSVVLSAPASMPSGGTARMIATVTAADRLPLTGFRTLIVEYRASPTSPWRGLLATQPAGDNSAIINAQPAATTQYRARFLGDATHAPSVSAPVTVSVLLRVAARLQRSTVTLGQPIVVETSVAPIFTGQRVALQIYDQGRWRDVVEGFLTGTGRTSLTTRHRVRGTVRYRVLASGRGGFGSGVSTTLILRVI